MGSNNSPNIPITKLILLGDSNSGKTSLLARYIDNSFNSHMFPTIRADFYTKTIELDGRKIKLQIWDTAGQERFRMISPSYYRGAMGILLLYDVKNPESFENLLRWLSDIDKEAPNAKKVLIGAKCDINVDKQVDTTDAERMISLPQANPFFSLLCDLLGYPNWIVLAATACKRLASEFNMKLFETSARDDINITEAFTHLANDIMQLPTTRTMAPSLRDQHIDVDAESKNNNETQGGCGW